MFDIVCDVSEIVVDEYDIVVVFQVVTGFFYRFFIQIETVEFSCFQFFQDLFGMTPSSQRSIDIDAVLFYVQHLYGLFRHYTDMFIHRAAGRSDSRLLLQNYWMHQDSNCPR